MLNRNYLCLHHSDIPGEAPQYDRIREYHHRGAPNKAGKKKWPAGYGCQYAFGIEKSGEIIQANEESRITWHAGTFYWNQRSIAVCLAGSFPKEKPTDHQLKALASLYNVLSKRWGIIPDNVLNHRDVRKTDCPGINLKELLFIWRNKMIEEKIDHLKIVISRTEPPRKNALLRLLQRLNHIIIPSPSLP